MGDVNYLSNKILNFLENPYYLIVEYILSSAFEIKNFNCIYRVFFLMATYEVFYSFGLEWYFNNWRMIFFFECFNINV